MRVCYECEKLKGSDQEPPGSIRFEGKLYCRVCAKVWVERVSKYRNYLDYFSANLKESLDRPGLKAKLDGIEVANRANISQVMFYRYCGTSGRAYPSFETFVRLCLALNATPNELLGFEDPKIQSLEKRLKRELRFFDALREAVAAKDKAYELDGEAAMAAYRAREFEEGGRFEEPPGGGESGSAS